MNEQVDNAIGGYEDCHPVNQQTIQQRLRTKADCITMGERIEFGSECNLMHEAAVHIDALEVKLATQAAELMRWREGEYTREELSAFIATKMCDYGEYYSYNTDGMADAAIDALIAIGAVRVK